MPIYEYRCSNGHSFEVFQRMSDPPAETCDVCGVRGVEKVLFPVAVHFKGSGFYSTDYGRGSRKGGSKEGEGGAKDGEGGSAEKKQDGAAAGSDAATKPSGEPRTAAAD